MNDDADHADLLHTALERYRQAVSADRQNRDEALDDLKFLAGEQWLPEVERQRTADGRPCLTINRLPQFVRQVTGDIRLNTPAIVVRPVDGGADPKMAETLSGLIRNIESVSDADAAYIQAAEHSVACGMGHFRVSTRYEDDDAWQQAISIEGLKNPFSVIWDPLAVKLTREDARYCFVAERVDRKAFREMFPDSATTGIDNPVASDWQDWANTDTVLIAEYWVKKPVTRVLARMPDGQVLDLTGQPPALVEMARADGGDVRMAEGHAICSYLITANEVLAGPFEWPGKYIPIVPVIGTEITVGDRVVRSGMVRYAKDAQRSFNYHRSAEVETVALQPKAPFIATVEQIRGLEEDWDRANQDNISVLRYNPDPLAPGPPTRVAPPLLSQGLAQLSAEAADDMKAVTGIYDAALGARSNETSGRAILARQREGDVGSFHYIDNLSKAIAHAGRILVDLIPRIYDHERVVRVLGEDGCFEIARINVETPDGRRLNDLSVGRYDVTVKAGPSFSSRRDEAAQAMLEFVRAYPPAAGAIGDLLADAMDWPGSKEIAARLKAMMPPGLAEKAKAQARGEEPPQMPEPPPSPDMIEAQARATKAQAEAMEAQIKVRRMEMGMDLPAPQKPDAPPPFDPFADREAEAKARKAEADAARAEADAAKAEVELRMMLVPPAPEPEAQPDQPPQPTQLVLGPDVAQVFGGFADALRSTGEASASAAARAASAAEAAARPKRLVRGPDGRATGLE
jgi:hypothetical protein